MVWCGWATGRLLQALKKTWAALTRRERIAIWLLVSAVAVLSGPFGTFDLMQPMELAVFWTTSVGASIVLAVYIRYLLEPYQTGWHVWQRELTNVAVFALVFTPALLVVSRWSFELEPEDLPSGQIFLWVCLIALTVATVRQIVTQAHPPEAPPVRPRLADRLPADAAPVSRLTVTDHYVEVFLTDGAHHRLLMRFADAVLEMDGVSGHCTHRSHWVTVAAIQTHRRTAGRDELILTDGTVIPVSRKYRPGLVAAGIIDAGAPGLIPANPDQADPVPQNGTAKARRPVKMAMARGPNNAASGAVPADNPPV